MPALNLRVVRLVAWLSLAAVVLADLAVSFRSAGGWGLGANVLFLFPTAAAVIGLMLMPRELGALFGHPDLLLPLALVTAANHLLDWLAAMPLSSRLLTPSFALHALGLGLTLSPAFLIRIAFAVGYASWMTAVVLQWVRTQNHDPCKAVAPALARFGRVLLLELIGWAVSLVATALLLLLLPALGAPALVLLFLFAVGWNYATAAALPIAGWAEAGFWPACRTAVTASIARGRKWGLLLLAQLFLLGLVFYYHRAWTDGGGNHENVNWSVNTFWTGGYEDECRWYGKLAEMFIVPTVPVIGTLLSLVFAVFAIGVKMAIVRRWAPPLESPPVVQA